MPGSIPKIIFSLFDTLQIKDIYSTSGKKGIFLVLKISVTALCIAILFVQVLNKGIFSTAIELPAYFYSSLLIVALLMVLNWYLEVLRWQISVNTYEKLSIRQSWRDVLSGLLLNLFLPFTSGDVVSRIALKSDKYKTAAALFLNRMIMLGITFLFGVYGISYKTNASWHFEIQSFILIGLLLSGIFFFRGRLQKFTSFFNGLSWDQWLWISLISIIRYAVFTSQLFLLLKLFNPGLSDALLIAGIGCVFMARSIIPSLFGGIGLRELSAFYFFENLVVNISTILLPVTIIWLVNMVVPSIAGSVLIWLKRFKSNEDIRTTVTNQF